MRVLRESLYFSLTLNSIILYITLFTGNIVQF